MQIRLYKFAKLLNSTATPDADGESANVTLKDSSPKDNPVFVIHRNKLKDYNYLRAEFDNETVYYFINSPTYLNNDLVEIPCTIDYLATYKQGIKSSAQYIERSSDVSIRNGFISDSVYPLLNNEHSQTSVYESLFTVTDGFYVIGIIGFGLSEKLTRRGSVCYVIMTSEQVGELAANLLQLEFVAGDLNPIQYFVSCTYIPIALDAEWHETVTDDEIKFGSYSLSISYEKYIGPATNMVNGVFNIATFNKQIPIHSKSNLYGEYLNFSPWLSTRVYFPGFGEISIPIEKCPINSGHRNLLFYLDIDVIDGSAILSISGGGGERSIYRNVGRIGVPTQLAQITSKSGSELFGLAAGASSFGMSALTGNYGGAVTALASTVSSAYNWMLPRSHYSGSNGSMAEFIYSEVEIITEEYYPADQALFFMGYPVFKIYYIDEIATGSFIKCRNAKLQISANRDEIEAIENIMNEGFYYE